MTASVGMTQNEIRLCVLLSKDSVVAFRDGLWRLLDPDGKTPHSEDGHWVEKAVKAIEERSRKAVAEGFEPVVKRVPDPKGERLELLYTVQQDDPKELPGSLSLHYMEYALREDSDGVHRSSGVVKLQLHVTAKGLREWLERVEAEEKTTHAMPWPVGYLEGGGVLLSVTAGKRLIVGHG